MGSSIPETFCVTRSTSLPSAYGDKTSTVGTLTFTLQKTAEKKETRLNKGHISLKASSKASNKEKAVDYNADRFESGKDQSRDSLSSEKATSNSSTPAALGLIPSKHILSIVVSTSITANYATVLLGSPSVLPSKLSSFRETSPGVDSGFTSKDLYSNSSVVPVWTANMLGNAYGGGYVVTPSIFVTSFPDSPSSSGIPPGYERSSQSEDFQSSRSPTRVSVCTGGVLTLAPGLSKEEATLGVLTSASALDALIDILPTSESGAASSTQVSPSASNYNLFKPVGVNKPSLARNIPINETDKLNVPQLLPSASANLGRSSLRPFPLNQSVIGAYSPTSVLEFQGLAFRKTVNCSLGLICVMALFFSF